MIMFTDLHVLAFAVLLYGVHAEDCDSVEVFVDISRKMTRKMREAQ